MPAFKGLFTSAFATGIADKIRVVILNDDDTTKTYNVQAQHLVGKTETEINTTMDNWLAGNGYADLIGTIGVHINRNGSFTVWTNRIPPVWPEDE